MYYKFLKRVVIFFLAFYYCNAYGAGKEEESRINYRIDRDSSLTLLQTYWEESSELSNVLLTYGDSSRFEMRHSKYACQLIVYQYVLEINSNLLKRDFVVLDSLYQKMIELGRYGTYYSHFKLYKSKLMTLLEESLSMNDSFYGWVLLSQLYRIDNQEQKACRLLNKIESHYKKELCADDLLLLYTHKYKINEIRHKGEFASRNIVKIDSLLPHVKSDLIRGHGYLFKGYYELDYGEPRQAITYFENATLFYGRRYPYLIYSAYRSMSKGYRLNNDIEKSFYYYRLATFIHNNIYSVDILGYQGQLDSTLHQIIRQNDEIDHKDFELSQMNSSRMILHFSLIFLVLIGCVILYVYMTKKRYMTNQLSTVSEQFSRSRYLGSVLDYVSVQFDKNQIEALTQQRDHLAKELHDDLCNYLAIIEMKSEILDKQELLSKIDEVKQRIRTLSHTLSDPDFSQISLFPTLRTYIKEIEDLGSISIEYFFSEEALNCKILPATQLEIFRIFQELIRNVLRHSNASKLFLTINLVEDHFTILVEDNGAGFDITNLVSGLGLRSIKDRVRRLQGKVDINSEKNIGTIIHISIAI